jgi:hypothetical protein
VQFALPRQRLRRSAEEPRRRVTRKGYVHPSQRAGSYIPSRGAFKGITFGSYRQYQNALARGKGFRSAATRLASPKKVTLKDGMAALARPGRASAIEAINRIRKGMGIGEAARESETTPATIKRYFGKLLRKGKSGRITVVRSDRQAAVMPVPTSAGAENMIVVGSRSRRVLGEYWAAVRKFRDTGRASLLAPCEGKTINVAGEPQTLLTDARTLTRLLKEGRLSIETIYAKGLG